MYNHDKILLPEITDFYSEFESIPSLLLLPDFLKLQSGFESHEKRDLLVLLLQPVCISHRNLHKHI